MSVFIESLLAQDIDFATAPNFDLNKDIISSPGLIQASVMASFAGLELTSREIFAYDYLRKRKDLYDLSDQKLLAGVLLLQGELDKYKRFITAYPNIFDI